MTLAMAHPEQDDHHIEVLHLPYDDFNAYHDHLSHLRDMIRVAAHHASQTGQRGFFETSMSERLPNSEGGVFSVKQQQDSEKRDSEPEIA